MKFQNLALYKDAINLAAWSNKFGLKYTSNVFLEQRMADLATGFAIAVAEAVATPPSLQKQQAWARAKTSGAGLLAVFAIVAEIASGRECKSAEECIEDMDKMIGELSRLVGEVNKQIKTYDPPQLPPFEHIGEEE